MNRYIYILLLLVSFVFPQFNIAQQNSYNQVTYNAWDSSILSIDEYRTGVDRSTGDSIRAFRITIDNCNTSMWTSSAYIIYCDSAWDDSLDIDLSLSTTGLAPGRHTLTISTIDFRGRMSVPQTIEFFIQPQIDSMEYYFDSDPGIGNGFALPTTITDSVDTSLAINIPGTLPPGLHYMFIRTRDIRGIWSLSETKIFYITSEVSSAEYFFDIDPGIGNGTPLSFTASDSISENFSITLPNTLNPGFHYIYIRTKTEDGNWSLYENDPFYITSEVVGAEYFFDTDPGPGNGNALSLGNTADSISENYSISVTGLSTGLHDIYIRTKDANGNWSLYEKNSFYIQPRIKAFKYWIDTIPGFSTTGTYISIPESQWSDSLVMGTNISLSCIDTGTHFVWVSVQDENGHWGDVQYDTFYVIPGSNISLGHQSPGAGPLYTPVKLQGTGGGGANYRYRNVTYNGGFQVSNLFYIPNDSTHIFQVRDTCGNYNFDTIIASSTPINLATGGGSGTTILSGYNEWVYIIDSSGNIIAALRDNGQNLDTVTASYYINTDSLRTEPTGNWYYLDRNWIIHTKNSPTSAVDVRLYWLNSELDSLLNGDPHTDSLQQCQITKYSGPNQNLSLDDNTFGGSYSSMIYPTWGTYTGNSTYGKYAQFSVTSFSEFYLGNGGGVPLALQWMSVYGECINSKNRLSWSYQGNPGHRLFQIFRSGTDQNWKLIETIESSAPSGIYLSYTDEKNTSMGTSVYYIKAIEDDGSTSTSPNIYLTSCEKGKAKMGVYPIPAQSFVFLSNLGEDDYIYTLYDISGKQVLQGKIYQSKIDISSLANGFYSLTISDNNMNVLHHISKLIKQ